LVIAKVETKGVGPSAASIQWTNPEWPQAPQAPMDQSRVATGTASGEAPSAIVTWTNDVEGYAPRVLMDRRRGGFFAEFGQSSATSLSAQLAMAFRGNVSDDDDEAQTPPRRRKREPEGPASETKAPPKATPKAKSKAKPTVKPTVKPMVKPLAKPTAAAVHVPNVTL
jgi:hypothetical protein